MEENENEFDFEEVYKELKEKYSLPDYEKLSEDFDIEKIPDKESSYPMREIRRIINEKISAYLHLFETLINPSSPPMFVFSILRNVSQEEKDTIKSVYQKLSKIQIEIMKLDTIYSKEKEAEFIKTTFKEWQDLKPTIYKVVETFEKTFEKEDTSKERGYFG